MRDSGAQTKKNDKDRHIFVFSKVAIKVIPSNRQRYFGRDHIVR